MQYVTITAKEDTLPDDIILLEVGSFTFDTAGAVALKGIIIAALSAISFSLY
jgi:hypothetical protein